MIFWVITIFFAALFCISFFRDKRKFSNAVLLMLTLGSLYVAIASYYGKSGSSVLTVIAAVIFVLIALGALVFTVMFIADGAITIKREGFRLQNTLSIIFPVAVWAGFAASLFMMSMQYEGDGSNVTFIMWMSYLGVLIVVAEAYVLFTFIALLFYSLIYRLLPKHRDCDFIIVHGAGLLNGSEVSPLLRGRLDKGVSVWKRGGSKAKIIVSGGKGSDETVSEAAAMKGYLLGIGIPEEFIVLEDRSTTTMENMQNSKKIIDEIAAAEGIQKYRCIFVTSDYHVFRTATYARKVKLRAEGIGCHTAAYYFPNAFIREYVAIIVAHKVAPFILLGLWGAGVALSLMH